MINYNDTKCSTCDGFLKYYDKVRRNVRTRYGSKYTIKIRRYRCMDCTKLHREMPPQKYYRTSITNGVLSKGWLINIYHQKQSVLKIIRVNVQ